MVLNKKYRNNFLLYLFPIIIILISVINITKPGLFISLDYFIPYHASDEIYRSLFMWNSHENLGQPNFSAACFLFPYLIFWAILQKIGIHNELIQFLWIFFAFIYTYFSAFYLCKTVLPTSSRTVCVIVGLFYLFNPFTEVVFIQQSQILLAGTCALMLAFTIRGVEDPSNFRYPCIIALISLMGATLGANPPRYIIMITPSVLYVCYQVITGLNKKETFYFSLRSFAYCLMVNSYWLFSYVLLIRNPIISTISPTLAYVDTINKNATVFSILRLIGSWTWDNNAFGSHYVPYAQYYTNISIVVVGITLAILIFFGLIKRKNLSLNNENSRVLFFSVLCIISVFLTKGSNDPFQGLFYIFFHIFSFMKYFREPFILFIPIVLLCFSVLLGYSLNSIIIWIEQFPSIKEFRIKNTGTILIFLFMTVLILLNGFPLLDGSVIPNDRGFFPGGTAEIPNYWIEATNYLNAEKSSSRILLLPENPFYQSHYFWNPDGYYGQEPGVFLINNPILKHEIEYIPPYYSNPKSMEYIKDIYANIRNSNLQTLLMVGDVQYILHRKDLDWTHLGTYSELKNSPEEIISSIKKNIPIVQTMHFGNFSLKMNNTDQFFQKMIANDAVKIMNYSPLTIYKLTQNSNNNHIRVSPLVENEINYSESTHKSLKTFIMKTENNGGYSYIEESVLDSPFTRDQNYIKNSGFTNVNYSYSCINPVYYTITITNLSNFRITFLESFDPNWILLTENEENSCWIKEFKLLSNFLYPNICNQDIIPAQHSTFAGYANQWILTQEKEERENQKTVVIYYWPQTIYVVALLISLVSIIFIIVRLLKK